MCGGVCEYVSVCVVWCEYGVYVWCVCCVCECGVCVSGVSECGV